MCYIFNIMPEAVVHQIASKLPKVGPRIHSVADFILAGAFIAAGAMFYRHNKKAAIGAALCGAATLAVSAITDFDGRGRKHVSYPSHAALHVGLAGMSAAMPALLDFAEESEAGFFKAAAVAGTAVGIATDYERRKLKSST